MIVITPRGRDLRVALCPQQEEKVRPGPRGVAPEFPSLGGQPLKGFALSVTTILESVKREVPVPERETFLQGDMTRVPWSYTVWLSPGTLDSMCLDQQRGGVPSCGGRSY